MYFDEYECGIYFNTVWNCPECSYDSETKTVFDEHLTQKHHFLFLYFDEYECGIYFNSVWNCPDCRVDSETKTVFEEHLTQKHQLLF